MSFRARLTLFFVLIVIVPLVSVAVIVFRLIGENEHGQADARVAQGQRAAIGLERRQLAEAGAAAARVGNDPQLLRGLATGNDVTVQRRAGALSASLHLQRIAVSRDGRTIVDTGSPAATAEAA